MELKKILNGIDGLKAKGDLDLKITNLTSDSRNVKKGSLFIAIKGYEVDGHDYINQAIEKGAIAILAQKGVDLKKLTIPDGVTIIVSEDTRYAMAICGCNFFGNPSRKFKLIGITGTKGKTTTSFMTKKLLEKQGYKVRTYWNNSKLHRRRMPWR